MNQFRRIQVFRPETGTHRPNPPIQNADGADLSRMYELYDTPNDQSDWYS